VLITYWSTILCNKVNRLYPTWELW